MKLSKINLVALLIIAGMTLACDDDDDPQFEPQAFEANFFTILTGFNEDPGCLAPFNFLNTQEGNGTATLIGKFTTKITFCVNPNNLEYVNGQGSFLAENGDEISFSGSGQVLPSDEPGYDLEFMDSFIITGGAGRFEGASGNLTTDSFVNMTTGQTDHVWSGTITLAK